MSCLDVAACFASIGEYFTTMKIRHVGLAVVHCPKTRRVLLITSRKHPNLWISTSLPDHSSIPSLKLTTSLAFHPLSSAPYSTSDEQCRREASRRARLAARPPPARRMRRVSSLRFLLKLTGSRYPRQHSGAGHLPRALHDRERQARRGDLARPRRRARLGEGPRLGLVSAPHRSWSGAGGKYLETGAFGRPLALRPPHNRNASRTPSPAHYGGEQGERRKPSVADT